MEIKAAGREKHGKWIRKLTGRKEWKGRERPPPVNHFFCKAQTPRSSTTFPVSAICWNQLFKWVSQGRTFHILPATIHPTSFCLPPLFCLRISYLQIQSFLYSGEAMLLTGWLTRGKRCSKKKKSLTKSWAYCQWSKHLYAPANWVVDELSFKSFIHSPKTCVICVAPNPEPLWFKFSGRFRKSKCSKAASHSLSQKLKRMDISALSSTTKAWCNSSPQS